MIAHSRTDGPLTTSTQLRRGKFEQRPGEKWQGRQLDDGVRPSVASTAAKQHRQDDDKARVGQEGVRYDPRQRDAYNSFVRNANANSQLRFLPPRQRMQLKKYRGMYIDTADVAMILLIPEGVGVRRRRKTQRAWGAPELNGRISS